MEVKLLGLEQVVSLMKMDQQKDKESVGRLEITNLKNSEEFRAMLGQVSNEMGSRMEVKLTDLVNRLLAEQEVRMRAIDDVKYTVDMKDRLTQEKSKH